MRSSKFRVPFQKYAGQTIWWPAMIWKWINKLMKNHRSRVSDVCSRDISIFVDGESQLNRHKPCPLLSTEIKELPAFDDWIPTLVPTHHWPFQNCHQCCNYTTISSTISHFSSKFDRWSPFSKRFYQKATLPLIGMILNVWDCHVSVW